MSIEKGICKSCGLETGIIFETEKCITCTRLDKLEKFINHLPQEKKKPTRLPTALCPKCGNYAFKVFKDLTNTEHQCATCQELFNEPTKESPDIQEIKKILLTRIKQEDKENSFLVGWVSENQLQAISALYRKEK